jgi:hypothetical protein
MGNPDETFSVYDGGGRGGGHLEVEGSGTVCTEMDCIKTPGLAPHPISAKKFLIFKGIAGALRCKILIPQELFADSS